MRAASEASLASGRTSALTFATTDSWPSGPAYAIRVTRQQSLPVPSVRRGRQRTLPPPPYKKCTRDIGGCLRSKIAGLRCEKSRVFPRFRTRDRWHF